ncbi:unnamed protein product [Rangifer tarandus platyrhynchus]|uniref:Uncharacterized protein n=2 Tax=Rangifer tarandus platyrhynchus TaxID=3082113 RepID=A0ABN8XWA2_RANTA|nr:unnamed protein product [Rangifer tarandus platyrhynchus]CAI9692476.1 unnamed protein product [Rangifer tarandus platyrhynchus]
MTYSPGVNPRGWGRRKHVGSATCVRVVREDGGARCVVLAAWPQAFAVNPRPPASRCTCVPGPAAGRGHLGGGCKARAAGGDSEGEPWIRASGTRTLHSQKPSRREVSLQRSWARGARSLRGTPLCRAFPEALLSLLLQPRFLCFWTGKETSGRRCAALLSLPAPGWSVGGSKAGWIEDPSTETTAGASPPAELFQVGSGGEAQCWWVGNSPPEPTFGPLKPLPSSTPVSLAGMELNLRFLNLPFPLFSFPII